MDEPPEAEFKPCPYFKDVHSKCSYMRNTQFMSLVCRGQDENRIYKDCSVYIFFKNQNEYAGNSK